MLANLTTYKQLKSKTQNLTKKNNASDSKEGEVYYPHIRDMPVDVSNI